MVTHAAVIAGLCVASFYAGCLAMALLHGAGRRPRHGGYVTPLASTVSRYTGTSGAPTNGQSSGAGAADTSSPGARGGPVAGSVILRERLRQSRPTAPTSFGNVRAGDGLTTGDIPPPPAGLGDAA